MVVFVTFSIQTIWLSYRTGAGAPDSIHLIFAAGPISPLPAPDAGSDEPWRVSENRQTRFVPMQAKVGDYALFFRKAAVEINFERERYLVVPQAAILALVRDDEFDIDSL